MSEPNSLSLRREVEQLRETLAHKEAQLKEQELTCAHEYERLENRVGIRPAYTIPEFRKGSDFSPELYVPEERTIYYQRRCTQCGLVEETTKLQTKTVQGDPDWGAMPRASKLSSVPWRSKSDL